MVLYASADQIARAVIVAAHLTGADPLNVVANTDGRGSPNMRARKLAFAGLVAALPGARVSAIARGLGFPYKGSVVVQKITPRPLWLREDWLDEVVGAVLAPEIEPVALEEAAPEQQLPAVADWLPEVRKNLVSAPSEPAPHRETLPQHDRKPQRRMRHALPMGEPEAGRSALDQRRAGIVEEDLPEGRWNKKVSLPSLSFLSKGF